MALTLGTSGVVFASHRQARSSSPRAGCTPSATPCPAPGTSWASPCRAAGSLQWYRDTLAPGESFDALVAEAAEAPAGSEGLLFLPYLSGERTPYPDPLARGSFVGLTLRHKRGHLTRAVLEGVAFSMRDCFGLLREAGLGAVGEVRVAGGGAKSPLWRKICASVLGVELVTVNSTEGGGLRRRAPGRGGRGRFADVPAACAATIAVTGRDRPIPAWPAAYDRSYARLPGALPRAQADLRPPRGP